MTSPTPLETRIGALISAYADQAPISVDPTTMTRLAAGNQTPSPSKVWRLTWPERDLAFLLLILSLLIAIAAGSVALGGRLFIRDSDDVFRGRVLVEPFEGLPAVDAPPSSPESGELVVTFMARIKSLGNDVHVMHVYEDGRVIWKRNLEGSKSAAAAAFGAHEPTTAVIEQRLTPEGVDRLRSEALTAGQLSPQPRHGPGVVWGSLKVRVGDALMFVDWSDSGLPGRLADPAAWLPPSAWADQRIGAYVASRYAVCADLNRFEDLPDPIEASIKGSSTGLVGGDWTPDPTCHAMSTKSAREVADTLAETAGEPKRLLGGLDYTLPNAEAPAGQIHVHFVPITPHGDGMCLGCG
jgi:hypothetical protein